MKTDGHVQSISSWRRRWLPFVFAVVILGAGLTAPTEAIAAPATSSSQTAAHQSNVAMPHSPRVEQQLQRAAGTSIAGAAAAAGPAIAGAAATVPSGVQGVDVASIQHPGGAAISWGAVAGAGYSFAFVKASEGTYYTNPYYAGDISGARAAGLYVAAYHFATPDTTSGIAQADYALNNAGYTVDGHTMAPALDIEYNPYGAECYGLSTSDMVAWIQSFSNEVATYTGHLPFIYTTADWWNTCTGGSTAFAGNPLWVAEYGIPSPTLPASWTNWQFWQYTSTGSVAGINGNVDLSYFNGDAASLSLLAGWLGSGPAATSRGPNTVDAFAVDQPTRSVIHKWWDGSQWQGYEDLGGVVDSGTDPAATASGPNRLDVFIRGTDLQLWHKWWNGASWSAWEPLGGLLNSSPAAVSSGNGRIDVFVRGIDEAVWHQWWNGVSWSGWDSLGGYLVTAPSVASRGPGIFDVFVGGMDGALWYKDYDGSTWSGWNSLGGLIDSDPSSVSWGSNRLDVVVRATDLAAWQDTWDGTGWSGWHLIGGYLTSKPAIAAPDVGRLDVFVRGSDNDMWHTSWSSAGWTGWEGLGG